MLRFLWSSVQTTSAASVGLFASYVLITRKCKIRDVDSDDYLFNHKLFAKYNPNNAPVTQDLCLRKVNLSRIRPELLEKDGKLVEAFCAGIWGGIGYAYQRRYLETKYRRDPVTADDLWDRHDLKQSTYEVGTKITDHFEVVSKTSNSIIVRCGDSPRIQGVRASDGLFEMIANVKKEEGVVEFGLKSIFYNGLKPKSTNTTDKNASGPMSPFMQWLHQQYDKIWMETALYNCVK